MLPERRAKWWKYLWLQPGLFHIDESVKRLPYLILLEITTSLVVYFLSISPAGEVTVVIVAVLRLVTIYLLAITNMYVLWLVAFILTL